MLDVDWSRAISIFIIYSIVAGAIVFGLYRLWYAITIKVVGSVQSTSLIVRIPLIIGCINTFLVILWLIMYGGSSHYSGIFYEFGGFYALILLIPISIGSIGISFLEYTKRLISRKIFWCVVFLNTIHFAIFCVYLFFSFY